MLNFVVTTLSLHLKEKERNKSKYIAEMKPTNQKKQIKYPKYGYCEYCGQYLPWFCTCYLNKKE